MCAGNAMCRSFVATELGVASDAEERAVAEGAAVEKGTVADVDGTAAEEEESAADADLGGSIGRERISDRESEEIQRGDTTSLRVQYLIRSIWSRSENHRAG